MVKTRLLQAVCAVALLAAAPAFAQSESKSTMTSPGAAGSAPVTAAPASHPAHRMSMTRSSHMMHGKSDESQDSAVNRLNDQSYQAAQQGQPYSSGPVSTGMTPTGGAKAAAGGTADMSGSSMTGKNGSTSSTSPAKP